MSVKIVRLVTHPKRILLNIGMVRIHAQSVTYVMLVNILLTVDKIHCKECVDSVLRVNSNPLMILT